MLTACSALSLHQGFGFADPSAHGFGFVKSPSASAAPAPTPVLTVSPSPTPELTASPSPPVSPSASASPTPSLDVSPSPTPSASGPLPSPSLANISKYKATADELKVISLINAERRKANLSELAASSDLCAIAHIKAQEMTDANYFSHTSPTYGSAFDMMHSFSITFHSAGENIAKASSLTSVVSNWMVSEGHKEIILNSGFKHVGVGISGMYYVAMFTD